MGGTLGGWLGYVFTPLFTCFLPSRERLNQVSYQRGSRVSYVRRGFAFLVDAGVEVVVAAPLWLILPLGQRSGTAAAALGAAILCQGILPALWHGQTLGKALVKIRLTDAHTGGTASPERYLLRGVLLWGVLLQPLAQPVTLPVLLLCAAYNGIRNRPQMFYEKWLGLTQASTVTSTQKKAEKPQDAH